MWNAWNISPNLIILSRISANQGERSELFRGARRAPQLHVLTVRDSNVRAIWGVADSIDRLFEIVVGQQYLGGFESSSLAEESEASVRTKYKTL